MKPDKVTRHKEICDEINALYERKNHDYGDSFHQTFEEEGMAMARIRLDYKFSRFKTLTRSDKQEVKDESIRDTLIDLANYAIMTVLEMEVAGNDAE
jgi:iron uptake system EfeUOB component EfeO/EfeM